MDAASRHFWAGMGRAFAGAIVFALPLLMTMEMWSLGFSMDRLRLALLLALSVPVLTGLSHFVGFESTFEWREDLRDAFIALAIGALAATAILALLAILGPGQPPREMVGKVMLQAVPGAFGAMLARAQFGGEGARRDSDRRKQHSSYGGELFQMAAGALYLAFSVAPTDEMVVISFRMEPKHGVALGLVSILLIHTFVYVLQFCGTHRRGPAETMAGIFLRFSVTGYAVALAVSLYVLWTFGRTQEMAPSQIVLAMVVLGFPAALGAAAARVIL